jgi:hypothetical protein
VAAQVTPITTQTRSVGVSREKNDLSRNRKVAFQPRGIRRYEYPLLHRMLPSQVRVC